MVASPCSAGEPARAQRRDRLFLAGEVVREGPAGHVRRVGDVLHPDVLQAALDRELPRGLGQRLLGGQLLALPKARAARLCRLAVHDSTIDIWLLNAQDFSMSNFAQ
jgi:hypothetical protein